MNRKKLFWCVFIILEILVILFIVNSFSNNIVTSVILLLTLFFSPYIIYDLTKAVFSIRPKKGVNRKIIGHPKVSILYTTFNEFFPDSIRNAMKLTYKNYDIWVLDDSTDPKVRKEIDAFCKKNSINVIRRKGRKGFKAGAINYAMNRINADFFLILDSDSTVNYLR